MLKTQLDTQLEMKPNRTRCLVCDAKVFQCVIYAVLLLTTSYFITEMFEEYLEENTNFSVTKQSLTKDDLPTLTICLKSKRVNGTSELKYGRDFKIQTLISTLAPWDPKANATLITLQEGDNEYVFMGQKRLTHLQQLVVYQFVPHYYRNCIRIQFTLKDSELAPRESIDQGAAFDMGMFPITLTDEVKENIKKAMIYITSEDNSYGIMLNGWYDGKVEPFVLRRGSYHSGLAIITIPFGSLFHNQESVGEKSVFTNTQSRFAACDGVLGTPRLARHT